MSKLKRDCLFNGQAGKERSGLANGELCSVSGKWEKGSIRVAAPRRQAQSPRGD